MHWIDIVIGILFAFGGLVALVAALASWLDRSYMRSLLAFSFGLAFTFYGVLHFAEGIGARWATPRLRVDLYPWFAIPCVACWLVTCMIDRRKRRQ